MSSEYKAADQLQAAISQKDIAKVQKLLKKHAKDAREICSVELPRLGTALHLVAKLGNVDIAKEILKTGMNIDVQQTTGAVINRYTPLHFAVKNQNFDMVLLLTAAGANLNAQEDDGYTPLHIASQLESEKFAEYLVSKGAEVNIANYTGQTPLHESIVRGRDSTSEVLISNGADANAVDKNGQSPLHFAAEWGNVKVAQSLINQGAKVNLQDSQLESPLHRVEEGDKEMRELLVQHGADTDLRDKRGQPAIHGRKIDMNKKEFVNINNALSQHSQKKAPSQPAFVMRSATGKRPQRLSGDFLQERSKMILEVQNRRGMARPVSHDGSNSARSPTSPQPSPANTPTTPDARAPSLEQNGTSKPRNFAMNGDGGKNAVMAELVNKMATASTD